MTKLFALIEQKPYWSFGIGLAVFMLFYYSGVLSLAPQGAHIWRQSDCLSMTQLYAEGARFIEPEMHILLADDLTSGKSAGELPLLYYVVGKIWQITGRSYLVYRLFYLLILTGGLLALFMSLKMLLKNNFYAVGLTLLFFTSPVFIFYSVSFLTDAPALSFSLIGIYFFIRYEQDKTFKFLLLSFLFFGLSGLIKISGLIPFCVLAGVYFLNLFVPLTDRKIFIHKGKIFLLFTLVAGSIVSWVMYAKYYNEIHGFKYTFNAIYPIWLDNYELSTVMEEIYNTTSRLFFGRTVIGLIIASFVALFLFWKNVSLLTRSIVLLTYFGVFCYFILWTPLFGVHDYYHIPILFLYLGGFLPLFIALSRKYQNVFNNYWLKSTVLVLVLYNFAYAQSVVKLRFGKNISSVEQIVAGDKDFVDLMRWHGYNTRGSFLVFEEGKDEFNRMGISKEDKVIIFPDNSFNASLFLMNRKGWTNFTGYKTTNDIEHLKGRGATYLLINTFENNVINEPFLQPFLTKRIGGYKTIEVFDLRSQ